MNLAPPHDIQAVLFDMDGTLILSEDRTDRAVISLLAAHEISLDADTLEAFHGVTWEASARWAVKRWPALGSVDIAAELQRRFHATFRVDPPSPVPGAPEAVRAAAAELPVAVVTSSNRETLTLVCEQLELSGLARAVLGAEDCTRSKPSPEPYLLAAERLGVAPERCLVFEDSRPGILAARAAGAAVIAVGADSGHEPWITDYCDLQPDFFARLGQRRRGPA